MVAMSAPVSLPIDRAARGQSIIEVVTAMTVVTTVFLFLLDLTTLVLVSSKLDSAAKSAARAAAKEPNEENARRVVVEVVRKNLTDGRAMIANVRVPQVTYEPNKRVTVTLSVVAKIMVPVPGMKPTVDMGAKAVEPIVTVSK